MKYIARRSGETKNHLRIRERRRNESAACRGAMEGGKEGEVRGVVAPA